MAKRKTILCAALAAVLLLSLCACGAKGETIAVSGESVTIGDLALRPGGEAGRLAENGGVKLLIPLEYDELLITETPKDAADGTLFSVSEKASVEAAKEDGSDYDGNGWLFSIGRVDAKGLEELSTWIDVGGAEPIAEDGEGNTYVFFHPTDVRLYRHSSEEMTEAMEMWGALNEWAASVKESFLAENPQLKAFSGTVSEELVLENGGLRLTLPADVAPLLLTETPQDDEGGVLFTVSELASVEAAKDDGEEDFGPGWLFSIGRVDKAGFEEKKEWIEVGGAEAVAEDEDGNIYLFYHPTDVRYYRHSTEEMVADQGQWTMLNEWAATVRASFLAENPGLKAFTANG